MSEVLNRAQRALVIQDVYVQRADAWADKTFDPYSQAVPGGVQFRVETQSETQILAATPPGEPAHFFVKFLVETGLRMLKPGGNQAEPNLQRDDLIGEISATFVVRYACLEAEQPTDEMLSEFGDHVIHHMWPYWREFLHATTGRLRLPPLVLPMRHAGGRLIPPPDAPSD